MTNPKIFKQFFKVAPRAGAWIEIRKEVELVMANVSPPARGRGLKCNQLRYGLK